MSHCLAITTCGCGGIDKLEFCEPFFNGIRIISGDILLWDIRPPYYGDQVNIDFYRWLDVEIGLDTQPTWHLTPGYKYIYNMSRRVFSVYDNSGALIHTKNNIISMGDMGIDFEIYKSHQFIIIKDDTEKGLPFFIPVDLIFDDWSCGVVEDMDRGILNYFPVDTKRPYDEDDIDNPTVDMHYIEGYITNELMNWSWIKRIIMDSADEIQYRVLTKPDISFKNAGYDPLVICDRLNMLCKPLASAMGIGA